MIQSTAATKNGSSAMAGLAGKYLTFRMADEEYGVEILKVHQIIGMLPVTHVPRMPSFVRGVINLRGKILPVVDMRLKFGLQSTEDTPRTCIIVLQVPNQQDFLTMGIIVDEVSEVIDISDDQVEPTPGFGADVPTDFLLGIGKAEEKIIMLLDVDKVLSAGEINNMRHLAADEQPADENRVQEEKG